ncbi:tRNA 5-methoxyuridine(34)/uridine 5-oxyacetic acid(34) synthase CmoB [Campylobacter troglodytis]|uniref:tRNA 5-methoxyuridine(34)/uridine 5-oxyacetic acid(34) synthase CmoB n=1 Tax=Campylobacter troglodytis TaxID=654363 RepID=UPI001158502C|nr:tRNA 5-methoxyuridine(34)/uridine 5-oxyacetic acid(34) synthase CmoB [Campylobacter troglodytis]TQR61417.1 tRNA 5-methoxyuridine(34)/uridine 5-oxyacetic acid(34) synthase CmoB [Campylobacter troglodytis]
MTKELLKQIESLEKRVKKGILSLDESVNLSCELEFNEEIKQIALDLKPWRKGPFRINELFIDSEWQSFVKFNLLKPYLNEIQGKVVADVGCNNGYYMFKMLEFSPKKLVGFDPSMRCFLQFKLINALAKTAIKYELLGVEALPNYKHKFDLIFCLGVLYHRSDPLKMLKELKAGLNKKGVVFLDTVFIEDEREIALVPKKTYSKISNIYFVPSILALKNWCERAGFSHFEVLATKTTDSFEQRKTEWSDGFSLSDFLDPLNSNLTCEGYPAPQRVYVRLGI